MVEVFSRTRTTNLLGDLFLYHENIRPAIESGLLPRVVKDRDEEQQSDTTAARHDDAAKESPLPDLAALRCGAGPGIDHFESHDSLSPGGVMGGSAVKAVVEQGAEEACEDSDGLGKRFDGPCRASSIAIHDNGQEDEERNSRSAEHQHHEEPVQQIGPESFAAGGVCQNLLTVSGRIGRHRRSVGLAGGWGLVGTRGIGRGSLL